MGADSSAGSGEEIPGLVDSITTSITADYFKTLGLDMKQGREFTVAEELTPGENRIAIIDETLATKLFADANPIDQLVQWQAGRRGETKPVVARVVGIVSKSHHQLLEEGFRPHIYVPAGQDPKAAMYLHAWTSAPSADAEAAMLSDVRREIQSIDAAVPIIALETRAGFRERNLILWILRAGANIFVGFGALALFMSVVGVYGVKAYVVARRTREIGIRVALGATPGSVVRMIVRDGLVTTIIGLVIGLGLSVVAGMLIRNMLFGDGKFDATVIFGAVLALGLAATIAAWLPARRATKVAPTLALKTE